MPKGVRGRVVCADPTCSNWVVGEGLCGKHLNRMRNHGDTDLVRHPLGDKCRHTGCPNPPHARGLCPMHLARWRKSGTTDLIVLTDEQRFWRSILIGDDGWEWTGNIANTGYGRFGVGGRVVLAHRWAYEHFVGPIADGLTIDHLCHNRDLACRGGATCLHRRCVLPEHLEAVPTAVNTRRGRGNEVSARLSATRTHCKYGHEFTPENTVMTKTGRKCRICHNRRARESAERRRART